MLPYVPFTAGYWRRLSGVHRQQTLYRLLADVQHPQGLLAKTASKKFIATKHEVSFDVFEITFIFTLSHDTLSLPEIVLTLVNNCCGTFHSDTRVGERYTLKF